MANRQCAIAIQYTQVPSVQTNFPVVLARASFPASANEIFDPSSANNSQADGGDVRFYSDSALTTQLPCEIVVWGHDSTSGAADAIIEAHVKVPSLSNAVNTTIYIAYNTATTDTQPLANSTYGSQAVWDANYAGVYHLNGNGNDSTANAANITLYNTPSAISGAFGANGLAFDGSTQYGDTSLISGSLNDQTQSAWFKTSSVVAAYQNILAHNLNFNAFQFNPGTPISRAYVWPGGTGTPVGTSSIYNDGAWHYMSASFDSTAGTKLGIDNTVVASNSNTAALQTTTNNLSIAATDTPSGYFAGDIDETRISSIARSADWQTAEYNNQSSPGTFAIAGTPTAVSGGSTPVSQTHQINYEALAGVKQHLVSQYEAMGYIAKQRTVLFETLQAIFAGKIAQYEGLSGLNQQAIMQIESLYRALAQHAVQFEYLQHATNTAQVNFESKGSALISSSVAIAFETLQGVALSKTLPIESLDKIASQVQAQIEAGQGISKTYNLFFEGKGFVSQTAINRLEVVAYLSAANIAQFESLQLISGTADLNIEALRLIANAAGVSFEALLGAGITVVVNTVTRTAHFTVTLERTATFGDTVSRTATFGDVINRTIKFH